MVIPINIQGVIRLFSFILAAIATVANGQQVPAEFRDGFAWNGGPPLVHPVTNATDFYYSVKDPTVVFQEGRWHLFVTVRGQKRSHQVEYISFRDWNETARAERHFLEITNGYYCAPQVFYFAPHQKWYLLYQASDTNRTVALQPAFSTNAKIDDWRAWTPPQFLYDAHPKNIKGWIDFWIICDDTRAHLFFTSNNGLMWRAETKVSDFPRGWSEPKIVLRDDIFEASCTYKIKGADQFLTIVEAQGGGRRYYKAYLADKLDGAWKPLAATREKSFASPVNVRDTAAHWTDSFSHGELIRTGVDERMEVDPANLRFVFQGVLDQNMRGKPYGQIPWRLGILEPAR